MSHPIKPSIDANDLDAEHEARRARQTSFLGCAWVVGLLASTLLASPALADELANRCAADDAEACYELGSAYQHAMGRTQDKPAAFEAFSRGCTLGSGPSCGWLGWGYANGWGTFSDNQRAILAFELGCNADSGVGCSGLGYFLREGRGGGADAQKAQQVLDRAHRLLATECDAGDQGSCLELAWLTDKGIGISANFEEGERLYNESCERGNLHACDNLAQVLLDTPNGDAKRARTLYQRACNGGYGSACNRLGLLADKDAELAVSMAYYELACEGGCDWGCYNLAYKLESTAQAQLERAVRLYHRACLAKNLQACQVLLGKTLAEDSVRLDAQSGLCEAQGQNCLELVLSYEDLEGFEKAEPKVLELLRWGCEKGSDDACIELDFRTLDANAEGLGADELAERLRSACASNAGACAKLGLLYFEGRGLPQDELQAREFLALGCTERSHRGCSALGDLASEGRGGELDLELARTSWQRACSKGAQTSCLRLGRLLRSADVERPAYSKAKQVFTLVCAAEVAEGCHELGLLYASGLGVVEDRERAGELIQWACEHGDALACGHELAGQYPARGIEAPSSLPEEAGVRVRKNKANVVIPRVD